MWKSVSDWQKKSVTLFIVVHGAWGCHRDKCDFPGHSFQRYRSSKDIFCVL